MKLTILFVVTFFILSNGFSQKNYATKSAQVKFFSHTPAEDIEAINNQAVSKLIDNTGQVVFSLLVKGFRFENELMQEHFNGPDYMNSTQFPKGEFKGTIVNIAAVNFTKDGTYNVTTNGDLTIKGITKKVTTKGTVTIVKGNVSTKSIFKINVKDFGVNSSEVAKDLEITVTAKYD